MEVKIFNLIYILKHLKNSDELKKDTLFFRLNNYESQIRANWFETYNLGIKLKLFNEINNKIQSTSYGNIFYLMSDNSSSLNEEQKNFIFKNGVLNNSSFESINDYLKLFSKNQYSILELYYTEENYQELVLKDKLILSELNVLNYEKDKITINEQLTEILLHQKLFGKSELSQSEYDKILEEQRRVGERGEELTLQYEKKYFKQKKWNYQEKNVRIVGKKNIRLGYDVESFLTEKSTLNYEGMGDKHIEVKSRKYDEFSFIISKNELKMGEILSERKNEQYLIYFWNNLESNPTKPTKIIPFKELKIKTCENCLNYLVKLDRN